MLNFFICFYLYDVHSLWLPATHICRRHLFYYLFCFLLSDFLFFNIFDITILAAIITIPVNILLLIVISYFKKKSYYKQMYLFVYTVFYKIYCSINKFTCSKYISFLSILSSVCNRTRHQHILSLSSYFYTVELS